MTVTTARGVGRAATTSGPARAGDLRRTARRVSVALLLLMAAAAAGGLLIDDVYRDPPAVAEMFRGYDLTTLLLAVPLLAVALLRRSPRAQLLWLGALAYAGYNYALYVFGAAFNDLFLVHVAVFSLAVFGLVLALSGVDAAAVAGNFADRTPARPVATVLVLLGTALGAMWIVASVRFLIAGQIPAEGSRLILPTAFTHLGFVLDLSLLVPGYLLAGVLLWRRSAWGFVLAPMLLVSGVLHQIGYLVALLFQSGADIPGAVAVDPLELPIVAAYLLAAGALLGWCGRAARAPDRQLAPGPDTAS